MASHYGRRGHIHHTAEYTSLENYSPATTFLFSPNSGKHRVATHIDLIQRRSYYENFIIQHNGQRYCQ